MPLVLILQESRCVQDGSSALSFAYGMFSLYKSPLLKRMYRIPALFADTQRIRLVPDFKQDSLCILGAEG